MDARTDARPLTRRQAATAFATGVAACALVLANTAALRRNTDLAELASYRRLWADLARGIIGYVDSAYPLAPDRAARKTWIADKDALETVRRTVSEKVAQQDIRPHQFWRTIRDEPFVRERLRLPPPDPFDDPGRGLVLGAAFRARGGIAPFLILWLAPLLVVPVLLWTAYDCVRAGIALGGAVFLGLVGLSPFILETLSFARSSAGFYLVAVLLAVPLAVYAWAPPPPGARGLLTRWAAAGAVLGVSAVCRSGALFLVPALVVVLAVTVARLGRRRAMGLGAASFGLLVVPFLLLRQPEHHAAWAGVWQGLGDFDRKYGHSWSDPVAEAHVRALGAPALRSPEATAILRDEVLAHARSDPGWLAGIVTRRLVATVTQQRLWPTVRADGLWMERSTSPNEGPMDKYYGYTTTVDFLGYGDDHQLELPVAAILLPTLALVGWAAFDRTIRTRALLVLAVMAAALPLPLLVSTAGATEPQAFALAYLLGFSLLADALATRLRDRMYLKRAESTAKGRDPAPA